jgi:hypothetical protein
MLVSLLKRFGVKLSLNDPRWGRNPEDDRKAQDGRRPVTVLPTSTRCGAISMRA